MKKLSVLIAIMALIDFASLALADPGTRWHRKIDNPNRFTVLTQFGNEAVLDNETGRVWDRSPQVDVSVPAIPNTWFVASAHCYERVVGGRKGWRLPRSKSWRV